MCIPSWQSIRVQFNGWDKDWHNASFSVDDRGHKTLFSLEPQKIAEDFRHVQEWSVPKSYSQAFEEAIEAYQGELDLKKMVSTFEAKNLSR